MIYLASPYSRPCAAVREQRFQAVCRMAAALMRQGQVVFAPIVHSHPLVRHGLPTTWDFWERVDREHLRRCDELAVLTIGGWAQSRGVQAEIRIAGELGLPIRYLAPESGRSSRTLAHVGPEVGS